MIETSAEWGPFPAICVAAAQSGSGKTTLTLALLRALKRRGFKVQPFKCGPDYIDPTFHAKASGTPSINLDTWMMREEGVQSSWRFYNQSVDVAVVEGVMGLFDGRSPGELVGSTADCARLLEIPVILVVDAKGMAGSIAPLVMGYSKFHPQVRIVGVIANKVGSPRHTEILKTALEKANLPPLLGALPKSDDWILPERHLGLVPFLENEKSDVWFNRLADKAEEGIDIKKLLEVCKYHPDKLAKPTLKQNLSDVTGKGLKVAVAMDQAFHFYYQDNFRFLREHGYQLEEFSPLHDSGLPKNTDILYLGGGYPEMFGKKLSANQSMRSAILEYAKKGGTIYAECGGYMYLSKALQDEDGEVYPMCNVLNITANMGKRLRSLGYREVTPYAELPWKTKNKTLRGHEFHYSDMNFHTTYPPLFQVKDKKGELQDVGVQTGKICASYVHLHFSTFGAL